MAYKKQNHHLLSGYGLWGKSSRRLRREQSIFISSMTPRLRANPTTSMGSATAESLQRRRPNAAIAANHLMTEVIKHQDMPNILSLAARDTISSCPSSQHTPARPFSVNLYNLKK